MQPPEPQPGLIVAGKYRLEYPLAGGGMGAVWRARHASLDVAVAVKFMAPALATVRGSRARFEREAKAAARLKSPYVVQVLDYGVDRGLPYIVMELLDGEDLHARLERLGRMALAELSAIALPLTRALGVAHDAGIVHRDLKPRNIFLARAGDEEIVKILDFGIAKREPVEGVEVDNHTASGTLLGSPNHMSPEQARGGSVDHRSDLWSLAVVLYRALTGVQPFAGRTVGDVIARICVDSPPRPSSICPELSPQVDAFFERAFARNPELRFQWARELGSAFAVLAGLPEPPLRALEPAVTPEVVPRAEPTQALAPDGTLSASAVAAPARSRRGRRWAMGAVFVLAVGAATALAWRSHRGRTARVAAPAPRAVTAVLSVAPVPVVALPPPAASGSAKAAPTEKPKRHRTEERALRHSAGRPAESAPRIDPDFGLSVGN